MRAKSARKRDWRRRILAVGISWGWKRGWSCEIIVCEMPIFVICLMSGECASG
jgi:hypothetical protein